MSVQETEAIRQKLHIALNSVVNTLGPIQIGSSKQFPFGWRKAAKGRTVWRIIEEAISQNLEAAKSSLGFSSLAAADSEVGVYDFKGSFVGSHDSFFVNVKSAVVGARTNKDDISKADKLLEFFNEDINRKLFTATFTIGFNADMTVLVKEAIVMPTTWIPDIYVNPSNNGNLQSSKYKAIDLAVKRSNHEFVNELKKEIQVARLKKAQKL